MSDVKRTTIYLPGELKARLELAARIQGRTESDVICEALERALGEQPVPRPRLPLAEPTSQTTNLAEQVDELLEGGFGLE